MMWYEIPGYPGYRVNHRTEVLSLKGDEPLIMKTWPTGRGRTVMLRKDGEYVTCQVHDLMVSAGLGMAKPVVPTRKPHPEASRTVCDQGHEFTPENTMRRRARNGNEVRKCKECHRLSVAKWRAKQRKNL